MKQASILRPGDVEKELYEKLKERRPKDVPINDDGSITKTHNNTVDALRHSYLSGVAIQDTNELFAKIGGYAVELIGNNPANEKNMDYWNNAVGRKYGLLAKNRDELLDLLLRALANGELITNPNDPRKYVDEESLKQLVFPGMVFVLEESKTGENLIFYDPRSGQIMNKDEFVMAIKAGKYPLYEIRIIKNKETPVSKKDGSNNLD